LGKIRDKLKESQSSRGQLRVKLKKFRTQDLFAKGTRIQEPNSVKNMGEIEEIRSLKVN
jgi:hypothetical protein